MNPAFAVPEFDAELIARYDASGPRYTSYPTAPQFRGDFGAASLRHAIATSNADDPSRPLSLYVHVPFCRSPCFYCGCNRVITRDQHRADQYVAWLQREAAWMAPLFGPGRRVSQIHLGGGTPNFLDLDQMRTLMEWLARHFRFEREERREFAIEIDPRHAEDDYVRELAKLGFNRMSLGIQDFDPQVQLAVNRVHAAKRTHELVQVARCAGFESINVDLIYGLPKQTPESFERTVAEVIGMRPDRLALYGYAHLPTVFKAQRRIATADLPDPAERLALFGNAMQQLLAAGYVFIGMDHFALPGDELVRAQREGTLQRNFQGYSTHGHCDIVGLGVSAISRIGNTYSQNERDLAMYDAALDSGLSPVAKGLVLDSDDLIRRDVINELMCHGRLDKRGFESRHGITFDEYFADELARMDALGRDELLAMDEQLIQVTPRGRLLLRNIAMCFDKYLQHGMQMTCYSKTI